ncbi:GDP dissociation inhibitor [Teladorsagia circumcincta]|uniref:GDP dissociation inhibitor n=1 Tax=Teladorsagia circumcincta TaxID=45464 RepID=A0A2G9UFE0_TELCI|nr:GDP dissociation inhibitor [Teladorsagia circumcincta]
MMKIDKGDNVEEKTVREVVESEWRRFSIDLVPKVLLARGSMVQTLCDSEVAKYAEFKCVDRFLCLRDEKEEKLTYSRVPCSKGDIFQDETLGMVDKRKLMKFMTFCLEWNTKADELEGWKEYQDEPFETFLESQEITGELRSYIADAIGILHPNATTKDVTLLNLFQLDPPSALRLIEEGFEVCTAPKGFYLVHLTGRKTADESSIPKICQRVFGEPDGERPSPCWSLRFEVLTSADLELPMDNAVCVSGPDHALDYASSIDEAQRIFSAFWPDRDFLPRSLPKPEEEEEVVEEQPVEQVA